MKPGGFSCEVCERAFRWKRELAGKRVKCKCGERLTVPEKEPLSKAPPAKPGRTRVSAPSRTASSDIGSDAGSAAFLEALDSLSSTNGSPESTGTTHDTPVSSDPFAKHCPNCHRPVSHNAAVCLNCGTNLRSGKKIRTQRKRAKAEAKTGGVADGITGLKVGAWGLLLQAAGAVLLVVAVILAIAGFPHARPGRRVGGRADNTRARGGRAGGSDDARRASALPGSARRGGAVPRAGRDRQRRRGGRGPDRHQRERRPGAGAPRGTRRSRSCWPCSPRPC